MTTEYQVWDGRYIWTNDQKKIHKSNKFGVSVCGNLWAKKVGVRPKKAQDGVSESRLCTQCKERERSL